MVVELYLYMYKCYVYVIYVLYLLLYSMYNLFVKLNFYVPNVVFYVVPCVV